MQKEKMTFRLCKPDDDMSLVAKYIHLTDPYIYPCVCDINDDFFTDFIKKCADKPTNLFYYKNIYLALYDEVVVAGKDLYAGKVLK